MIVRELLTLLGFTVDKASYDRASKQYDAMADRAQANAKAVQQGTAAMGKFGQQAQQAAKGTGMMGQALGMFQRFAATAGISHLLKQYTTLASDANETRGALGQLFGQENIGAIEAWSQAQGKAMGRSEYDLQKYAAGLGAVLGPVTESREEAQRMAQSLSTLAVDLGSFFNTSDEAAMAALRSGLTGEMESLKKYGIVINEATLAEVAAAQGIKKKITAMTNAEKTQLRYLAILDRSKAAQGDAVRTSDGLANSTKALAAQVKTLGINAAKKVLPTLEKLTRWGRDALTAFNELAQKSHVLEAAMWTLAAVAAVLGAEFYAAFILPALGIAALILLVDELITGFRGGRTVIGDFFNAFFGAGAAEEFLLNVAAGWSILSEEMSNAWGTFSSEWGDASKFQVLLDVWAWFYGSLGFMAADAAAEISDALLWPFRKLQEWLRAMGMKTGPELQERAYTGAAGRGLDAREETTTEAYARRLRDRIAASRTAAAGGGGGAGARALATGTRNRQYAGRGLTAEVNDPGASMLSALTSGAPASVAAPAAVAGAGAGGGAVIVPVSTAAPTIHIHGMDEAKAERVARRALAKHEQDKAAAVGGRGRS